MKLAHRFALANFFALLYAVLSLFLAQYWIRDLTKILGNYYLSITIILFIAIIPGYLNMLLLTTLLLYRYQPVKIKNNEFPPVTILIPTYNEEDVIKETFRGIKQQDYSNDIEIILIDDGSTDNTIQELEKLNFTNLEIIKASHGGKAAALNLGLKESSNEIVVTIDADTFLYKNAIKQIVARILSDPGYAAVAGHVLVKNERMSRLIRIQAWDYMLGISAVKRQQSLFRGTLVAQGSFSIFRKKALLEVQGWKDRLGEDIVLTWALLKKGYKVGYEPAAFAFTNAPLDYDRFSRQRQRWARGMIEGFKEHIELIWKGKDYSSFFVALDLFFPFIDLFYTFVFIPGLIMAIFGYYYIVGLMTLLVIPITVLITIVMLNSQKHFMYQAGLKIRYNPIAVVFYVLVYQVFMSPICVAGYFKELFRFKKKW
jgi:biofilm PGA synthesis N-glycosyltransferase PgaC